MAYAGIALGRIDPQRPLSLSCNLVGAGLILWSLFTQAFNLPAAVMESAWGMVSLFGLARWALRRKS